MKDWGESIKRELNAKLEGINDKDIRFFRIEEFKRMLSRTENFSHQCEDCLKFKPEIEKVTDEIDNAIQHPGRKRRKYDRLIHRLAKHQRNKHGFYPPYFFTYNYSFWGILAGSVIGLISGLVFMLDAVWYFILTGFIFGLLAGQVLGGRKDKKIRVSEKLL